MTTKELRKEFCKKHDIPYTEFIDELFYNLRNYSYEEICELIGVMKKIKDLDTTVPYTVGLGNIRVKLII